MITKKTKTVFSTETGREIVTVCDDELTVHVLTVDFDDISELIEALVNAERIAIAFNQDAKLTQRDAS